jgi:hypothetical protein
MARKVGFDELPALFPEYLEGRARGRVVVAVDASAGGA